jgi:septal ring factor EnvC (AmiA/AmiB activator)
MVARSGARGNGSESEKESNVDTRKDAALEANMTDGAAALARVSEERDRLARENRELREELVRARGQVKRLELARWRGKEKVERQLAFLGSLGGRR